MFGGSVTEDTFDRLGCVVWVEGETPPTRKVKIMARKYEVTIKFLVEDDIPEDELDQFLGELQAPADDPSVDVYVYSVAVRSVDDRGRTVEQAHGRVIPAALA